MKLAGNFQKNVSFQLQSPSSCMLLAVFSLSLSSFFAKLSMPGIGVHATVFVRFFVPLVLLIFLLIIFQPSIKLNASSFKLSITRSLALISSQFLLFFAIQGLPLSEAILLYNTGPIITTLFSFLLRYKVSGKEWAGLLVGAVGVIFICHLQKGAINKYTMYGLLSGVAFSVSQLTLYISSKKEESLVIMFYLYLFTSFFAFLLCVFFSDNTSGNISSFEFPFFICLFSVGFFSLINQYFRYRAYKKARSPSSLSPLIYFSVIFSALLDFMFFSLAPDTQSVMGGLLIFAGAYLTLCKPTQPLKKVK